MTETTEVSPLPAPRGLGACHELLTDPLAPVRRAVAGRPTSDVALALCGFLGFAAYGAAAGLFQGGAQVAIAAWKAPAIAALTTLLCVPSLYVFGALGGARWTVPAFRATVFGLLGTLGMLLGGLLPIAWLFSSSSRYLGTVVWIHVLLWIVALGLAFRFLTGAFRELGARGGSFLWILLFTLVSFQSATLLRPILWRPAGAPVLRLDEKKSFFENLGDAFRVKPLETQPTRSEAIEPRSVGSKPTPVRTPVPGRGLGDPPHPPATTEPSPEHTAPQR